MTLATGIEVLERELWLPAILYSGQNIRVGGFTQHNNSGHLAQRTCRRSKSAALGTELSEGPF